MGRVTRTVGLTTRWTRVGNDRRLRSSRGVGVGMPWASGIGLEPRAAATAQRHETHRQASVPHSEDRVPPSAPSDESLARMTVFDDDHALQPTPAKATPNTTP